MAEHKELDIWKMSIDLAVQVYGLTKVFPDDEKYGLTSQMKRAVVSIPSNIAEGAARQTYKEYIRFVYIGLGSLSELETQIILAKRLNFIKDEEPIIITIATLKAQTINFIKYLKTCT